MSNLPRYYNGAKRMCVFFGPTFNTQWFRAGLEVNELISPLEWLGVWFIPRFFCENSLKEDRD